MYQSDVFAASAPVQTFRRQGGRWALFFGLALMVAVRVYCASVYRVDSDEPQHLHVVWGITHGMVQYRDLFDNHSPLFALLNAPIFRLLGERADIVTVMRLGMIPFYFGILACVYLIGARLFSPRVGAWTAAVTAVFPRFFCTSLEFRPDNLWALCWLASLAALVCLRRPGWRFGLAGLLLGTAFSVSMKTTVMALDLFFAAGLAWGLAGAPRVPEFGKRAASFASGLALVPACLLAWFASQGALPSLGYCLIRHNLIAASERGALIDLRGAVSLAVFIAVIAWSRWLLAERSPEAGRRAFMALVGGAYPVLLFVVWPLVTREDFLAFVPVAVLVIVPALLTWVGERRRLAVNVVLAASLVGFLALDVQALAPWEGRSRFHEAFVARALKLTDPGDEVMDTKGEMIYRNRPIYFALEEMTRWKYSRNLLDDDIPERMIAHGVCVATDNYGRYPRRTSQFIKHHFTRVAYRTLVAGRVLHPTEALTYFEIAIPARYAVIAKSGGPVEVDGKTCSEFVALAPGRHSLGTPAGSGPVAVVWAQAVERGFDPFYRPSPEERAEALRSRLGNIL
ncbi:MAG: ArnT family glycosyltransferase [Chthoniobacteraceae bacterium]